MSKTIAGLFDHLEDAQQVMHDLTLSGFRRDDISLVTRPRERELERSEPLPADLIHAQDRVSTATRAVAGGIIGGTAGLLAAAVALAIPGIGFTVAAGPALTILLGAAAGAVGGGLIGSLLHTGISEEHAEIYAEGVRRGMTLLLVKSEEDRTATAARLMTQHHVVDMEQRAGDWRKRGWLGFDVHAPPLSPEDLTHERRAARANRGPGSAHVYEEASMAGPVTARPGEPTYTPPPELTLGMQAPIPGRGAWSGVFAYHEPLFRAHSAINYRRMNYEDYRPAYLYGFGLRQNARHAGRDWKAIERETRLQWEQEHPGTWDRYQAAIRFGWETSQTASDEAGVSSSSHSRQ